MNVPMVNKGADGNGNETFTLKRLEVIGKIDANGLDIRVSSTELSQFSNLPNYTQQTCRCEVTGGIENTFCADLQIKLGFRLRFLECLGIKPQPQCMALA